MGHDKTMTNHEMAVELYHVNKKLETVMIPAVYDNLKKMGSCMETIDAIITELENRPEPPEPEEHNEKPPEPEEE